ncbi:asparagine synthase (glutamine-hydrolyzing) [Gracilibacillus halotolerans]|uniref:asparagine synthase (glutamine-hydrolyzing) n=1 Tax=Gracilibacillus halotolerans TaxID=74386 RepID=A0A841RME1_9BACI|nr:asparagine synthase (glutamine-hydrolyzing) [Gracilibacillus halotolerans]MBB6512626.1 asparagine synthase (glutamine-hydrolyzing) [Gracilibacillus halotolerans]
MSGIAGWIDFSRHIPSYYRTVENMTNTLAHRGPDDTNFYFDQHVGLGYKRLAIVDRDGGRQPMSVKNDTNQYIIAFNGEIYNAPSLRDELQRRGWSFESVSDTEVLLKAYIEWGADHLEHLNGIFSYAIWDEAKEQLFLARDRLGVKPLFYSLYQNGILIGSEIKAILAHDDIKAKIDSEGLTELFAVGPSKSPGSAVFSGIQELRAAHFAIFNKNGLVTRRYWNVKSEEHVDGVEETAEKVRHLLIRAVESQLGADVPVGTFLSGGVDSSAISSIVNTYRKANNLERLQTFSIDYEDNEKHFKKSGFQPNQDKDYIKKMVEYLGTEHFNYELNHDTLQSLLEDAVYYRDLPGMADVDSSLLWFCQQTSKEVKVVLSGEGADEIFGGYPWFHREEDLKGEGFPWIRSSDERQQLLRQDLRNDLDLEGYAKEKYQETIQETPLLASETPEQVKLRQMFYLNMHWFMPTLLDRKDRMSMGAGIEARVPFGDHHLVEYVWNIPWEIKMYNDREKGILRKAMEGILPDEVLYRKKSPYPKTHHPGYTKAVVAWLDNIINDKESRLFELLDKDKVARLVHSGAESYKIPWYGQLMSGPQLLAHLGQIDFWLRKYNVTIEK